VPSFATNEVHAPALFGWWHVSEWSGVQKTAALDQHVTNTGSSTSVTTGTTGTTAQATELLITGDLNQTSGLTITPTGTTTLLDDDSTGGQSFLQGQLRYKALSSTGTQSDSWTLSPSDGWGGFAYTFKCDSAPSLVQTKTFDVDNTILRSRIVLATQPVAGNMLFVMLELNSSTTAGPVLYDFVGNVYTLIDNFSIGGGGQIVSTYVVYNLIPALYPKSYALFPNKAMANLAQRRR
jgi:hypothetical protein